MELRPRTRVLTIAAAGLIMSGWALHRAEIRLTAHAPIVNVWYGREQTFGELGNPQQWINILGNVSGHSTTSLTYSLNGGLPLAVAIGPSMSPQATTPCPRSAPTKSQNEEKQLPLDWRYRLRRIRNDCRGDSLGRCVGRHATIWLHWISHNLKSSSYYPRRLYKRGDFNIELDKDLLREGSNTLTLAATDGFGRTTITLVKINYRTGLAWPLPYTVDWSRISDISRAIQIVDGIWTKTVDSLRTIEIGYDRVFAIGNLNWTNYEITVPIKLNAIDYAGGNNPVSGGAGLGLITHWLGHSFNPVNACECSQPRCGWSPSGATAWYLVWNYDGTPPGFLISGLSRPPVFIRHLLELHTWYIWKIRTESLERRHGYQYWMKFWRQGEQEPAQWDIQATDASDNTTSGSILLDAHHVDASFGNISIIPGPFQQPAPVHRKAQESLKHPAGKVSPVGAQEP